MRVLMFQERFVDAVRAGRKLNTIRKTARCKPGEMLHLRRWTGKPYRSKQETIRNETCLSVSPVRVSNAGVSVGGRWVDAEQIAKADGFVDFGEMVLWFGITHGLPFNGFLIRWDVEQPAGVRP